MTKKTVKRKRPMMINVADYMVGKRHLTSEQHGAYLLLLMFQHCNHYLPTDDGELSRIVAMPVDDWRKIREPILELLGFDDVTPASKGDVH